MKDKEDKKRSWHFINDGNFEMRFPNHYSYLYFPLTNEAGMISSITPNLQGDAKIDQNTFLLSPCTVEDLHRSIDGRNFWVYIKEKGSWSVAGNSAIQRIQHFSDQVDEKVYLEAGFLWHRLIRENKKLGVKATTTNFVPTHDRTIELMEVKIRNISEDSLIITPTAAIPIFGRSADNLRDHRHVTSLLNRIKTTKYGILVQPTMHFDERGHQKNTVSYAVLGADDDEQPPVGFFPVIEDFIGEGGDLNWPKTVIENSKASIKSNRLIEGYEALGGLRFRTLTLQPNQEVSFRIVLSIYQGLTDCEDSVYLRKSQFNQAFEDMKLHWSKKHHRLRVYSSDETYNQWLMWVTIQPVLRRIMGCSFLPYHDYGRGGRGWRDLWQDCLALLLLEPKKVRNILLKSFAGVRIDGSNATIIGKELGKFKADRNEIPRVWMDHGAWPFLTTKLYIDQSGDLEILLEDQYYFKDKHVFRCTQYDNDWTNEQGTRLLQHNGRPYMGTILEHVLIQHLTSFFHVGEHNIILLEDADWNDGMDMAFNRGESVAFTALYAHNIATLVDLLTELQDKKRITTVKLAKELTILFDTLQDPIDYTSINSKKRLLNHFFSKCTPKMSGEKISISIKDLTRDLSRKANWLKQHIRKQEWITTKDGYSWFNGYYDDTGTQLEGDSPLGVRMTLTGQTFTTMSGIATQEQVKEIIRSANEYLWDEKVGGIRINTNFNELLLNMGRCFAFAYGHKENGAMFSHMAMMFAYALYKRRETRYAYKICHTIYEHCKNFELSRIYPGIPEYINQRGRGMYTYLTGSASWYLLTVVTKMFGIHGKIGDLVCDPQLLLSQFNEHGEASIITLFDTIRLKVIYRNPEQLDANEYQINSICINGENVSFRRLNYGVLIKKNKLTNLSKDGLNEMRITLGKNVPRD